MSRKIMTVLAASVVSSFLGCGGGGGDSAVTPPDTRKLDVDAAVSLSGTTLVVQAIVYLEGIQVSSALVTVNSVSIPWSAASGMYSGTTTTTLTAGDGVTATVSCSGLTATAYTVVPDAPVVTDPNAAGSPYSAASKIGVAWNPMSSTPDYIMVLVPDSCTQSGSVYVVALPGSATSTLLPENTILANYTGLYVIVSSGNQASFTGNVVLGSTLDVQNVGVSQAFSTVP